MTAFLGTIALALCCVAAAWLDVSRRQLPNWLCLLTACSGLGFSFAHGGLGALQAGAIHAIIALVAGMVLFRFNVIGGGDAKFYAGCAAWFPLHDGLRLLMLVSFAGLFLVLGWFGYRQVTRARQNNPQGNFALVPYGLAISMGAIGARVWMA